MGHRARSSTLLIPVETRLFPPVKLFFIADHLVDFHGDGSFETAFGNVVEERVPSKTLTHYRLSRRARSSEIVDVLGGDLEELEVSLAHLHFFSLSHDLFRVVSWARDGQGEINRSGRLRELCLTSQHQTRSTRLIVLPNEYYGSETVILVPNLSA